jgi:metal-responsive CopG/Arc/MetJ family transcriptional regulator
MKRIVTTSELFKEDEYEIIFIDEKLCEEIDAAIKKSKGFNNREEFVTCAVDKFISEVSEDKIKIDISKKDTSVSETSIK